MTFLVKLDEQGRVQLPKEVAEQLRAQPGTELMVEGDADGLRLWNPNADDSSRIREEDGLLVYDAEGDFSAEALDKMRTQIRLGREAELIATEPYAKSA